jgi:hypothetical protein
VGTFGAFDLTTADISGGASGTEPTQRGAYTVPQPSICDRQCAPQHATDAKRCAPQLASDAHAAWSLTVRVAAARDRRAAVTTGACSDAAWNLTDAKRCAWQLATATTKRCAPQLATATTKRCAPQLAVDARYCAAGDCSVKRCAHG